MIKSIKLYVPKNVRILQPGAAEAYRAGVERAVSELKPYVVDLAKAGTPLGATGNLQHKTVVGSTSTSIKFEWIATHAAPVQYGSKKHWVPIAPLRLWAQVILGTSDPRVPYKIQAKLARKNTPGKRFVEKIRSKIYQVVIPHFKANMALLARVLAGGSGP